MVHFNLFDLFVYHRWGFVNSTQVPHEYSVFERTQAS